MIQPGTKIEVLASNKRNKGPNVGSIGFVVTTSVVLGAQIFRFSATAKTLLSYCEFAKHNTDSGFLDICLSMSKGGAKKLSLIKALVVFNRFGAKGRFRIDTKQLLIIVPMAPLKSKRTVKGFLKGVTVSGSNVKNLARYTAITTLPQYPMPLEAMNGRDLLTRLYTYTLAVAKEPEFRGRYNMTGEILGKRIHNKAIIDEMDLSKLPLTKTCQMLLKQIAVGKYDDEVYHKIVADNNIIQAVRDMRNVANYFFSNRLKREAFKLKRQFPSAERAYMMQYLEPRIREYVYYIMNIQAPIRNEIMNNTNMMNILFRSLSTVRGRTRHTK